MAKVQFSAVVGDARAKIGGIVFTKNRAASVVRRKVSPIQPRTQAQSGVRASFTSLSKNWGSLLTEAQRSGWRSLSAQLLRKNVFGQASHLTGLQLFQKLNRSLAAIGVAEIVTAPLPVNPTFPGAVTLTVVSGGTPSMSVTAANPPGATDVPLIEAAAPQSAGRLFAGKIFRQIFTATAGTAGPYNILSAYVAKFGPTQTGQRIQIRLTYVDNATGFRSLPEVATAISS
jgi:hypothetical protein